jgi:hypothetical protein
MSRAGLAAAMIAAAGLAPYAAAAQSGQVAPYVDTIQPGFRLPPVPNDPLDKLYPPPARPDPPPSRSKAPPPPYPGGTLGAAEPRAYPQGFTMTLERPRNGARSGLAASRAIDRPRQIGERLARCWRPPAAKTPSEATIRLSFTRTGAVIGEPRVTYLRPGEGADRAALRASILAAVQRCAPLRFTEGLGSAISGRPFTIRFVEAPRRPRE